MENSEYKRIEEEEQKIHRYKREDSKLMLIEVIHLYITIKKR
jgi:hypothetical protein